MWPWPWIIAGYAVFSTVIGGCGGLVAIFCKDDKRRRDAFRVFKLVWVSLTTASGLVAAGLQGIEATSQ